MLWLCLDLSWLPLKKVARLRLRLHYGSITFKICIQAKTHYRTQFPVVCAVGEVSPCRGYGPRMPTKTPVVPLSQGAVTRTQIRHDVPTNRSKCARIRQRRIARRHGVLRPATVEIAGPHTPAPPSTGAGPRNAPRPHRHSGTRHMTQAGGQFLRNPLNFRMFYAVHHGD